MVVPALLTSTSRRPKRSTAVWTMARHDASCVTSTRTAIACAPAPRAPAVLLRRSWLRRARDHDRCARLRHALGHAETDPAVAAGHDRDPARQIEQPHLPPAMGAPRAAPRFMAVELAAKAGNVTRPVACGGAFCGSA